MDGVWLYRADTKQWFVWMVSGCTELTLTRGVYGWCLAVHS